MVCRVAAIFRSLEVCFLPPALSDFIISNLLKSHINFCLKLTRSFCEEVVSSLVEPHGWNSATGRESELWLSPPLSCFPRLNREIKAKRPKNFKKTKQNTSCEGSLLVIKKNKKQTWKVWGTQFTRLLTRFVNFVRGRVTSVERHTNRSCTGCLCMSDYFEQRQIYIFNFVLFEPIPRIFCCSLCFSFVFFSSCCGVPQAHPAQAGCMITPGFLLAVRAGNNSIVRSLAGNQIHLTHVIWPASVEEQHF